MKKILKSVTTFLFTPVCCLTPTLSVSNVNDSRTDITSIIPNMTNIGTFAEGVVPDSSNIRQLLISYLTNNNKPVDLVNDVDFSEIGPYNCTVTVMNTSPTYKGTCLIKYTAVKTIYPFIENNTLMLPNKGSAELRIEGINGVNLSQINLPTVAGLNFSAFTTSGSSIVSKITLTGSSYATSYSIPVSSKESGVSAKAISLTINNAPATKCVTLQTSSTTIDKVKGGFLNITINEYNFFSTPTYTLQESANGTSWSTPTHFTLTSVSRISQATNNLAVGTTYYLRVVANNNEAYSNFIAIVCNVPTQLGWVSPYMPNPGGNQVEITVDGVTGTIWCDSNFSFANADGMSGFMLLQLRGSASAPQVSITYEQYNLTGYYYLSHKIVITNTTALCDFVNNYFGTSYTKATLSSHRFVGSHQEGTFTDSTKWNSNGVLVNEQWNGKTFDQTTNLVGGYITPTSGKLTEQHLSGSSAVLTFIA